VPTLVLASDSEAVFAESERAREHLQSRGTLASPRLGFIEYAIAILPCDGISRIGGES